MQSRTYQQWSMTLRGMGTLSGENLTRLRASRFLNAMMINLHLRTPSPHKAPPDFLRNSRANGARPDKTSISHWDISRLLIGFIPKKRPFFGQISKIAPASNTRTGLPSGPSGSSIAGIVWLGLIFSNLGRSSPLTKVNHVRCVWRA